MNESSIKINPLPSDEKPMEKSVGQLSVDIYHTDEEIVILAPIAGVSKEDITLEVTDDVLVIRGTRPMQAEIGEENYFTKECFWGSFSRAIVLPEEAEIQKINASFELSVLEIRIPKGKVEKNRIIKIKA